VTSSPIANISTGISPDGVRMRVPRQKQAIVKSVPPVPSGAVAKAAPSLTSS